MRPLNKPIKNERKKRMEKFRRKIDHYKMKQTNWRQTKDLCDSWERQIPTKVPKYLKEFSSLSIFKHRDQFPKKRELPGPFIGSKEISLNKGELKVLSHGPKFSLRFGVSDMDFKLQMEKMVSKQRINHNDLNITL